MYCPQCGSELAAGSSYCVRCGSPVTGEGPATPGEGPVSGLPGAEGNPPLYGGTAGAPPPTPVSEIPTYLAQAILTTIFCCLPFGIVAIVYSANASGKKGAGDYVGALQASRTARTWCWVSFFTGLGSLVFWAFWVLLAAVAEA